MQSYTIDDFYYEVQVYYNGNLLTYKDGSPVSFHVFIGIKGDANFDMKVDATDSSAVLAYFSKLSTAHSEQERNTARVSPVSCQLVNENPGLDNFAGFLVDVTEDVYSPLNWTILNPARVISAPDASYILKFYSKSSTGASADYTDEERWNMTILGREEQMRAILG